MMKFCLSFGLLCFYIFSSAQSTTLPQLGKNSIQEVINAMTLEEKAQLVSGIDIKKYKDSLTPFQQQHILPNASGYTYPIKRLGIPSITLNDGPAGVRADTIRNGDSSKKYYATAFPVGTLLASSWDTALVRKVAAAFGNEVLEYGIDIILAPGMNIQRNPLGGRNFEYYSEDPLLSGTIASAFTKGIQQNGVGVSIKHFVANNQESARLNASSDVSQRALREIYLRNFEIAVKNCEAWTLMSSYNKMNGLYTAQNKDLLTTILRDEWHYKGLVTSDWGAGDDAVAQQNAGNNILMEGDASEVQQILEAVKNKKLNEKVLNENVAAVLNLILKTPSFKQYQYSNHPDLKAHAAISREGADESMVLLKNNDVLPFINQKNIALFGNTSYYNITGGTGSGGVNKPHNISLVDALQKSNFNIDKTLKNDYENNIDSAIAKSGNHYSPVWNILKIKELNIEKQKLQQLATSMDIAVITIGRNSGEALDRPVEDFNLTKEEMNLINDVSFAFHAAHKKVVVVLNISNQIDVASWRDKADAILLAWQPGQEGGYSILDILSGRVNPSGKLAATFPMKYEDVPSAKNFPFAKQDEKIKDIIYQEGIYVGYRYYNTFNVKPAYEFGYGLSYTSFKYADIKLNSSTFNKKITAQVTITNTGKTAGREVVELYLSAPHVYLEKPESELKGFAKTTMLKPGESQTLLFTITPDLLASFDTKSSSWIAEKGKYVVKIGASSLNIRQSASFNLSQNLMVEKVHDVLKPTVTIDELHQSK